MVGISSHSIFKLTENPELQVRDCYPIARAIVEGAINIAFIMAKGRPAAERADRHAQQKSYRDLKRSSSAGGWTVEVWNSMTLPDHEVARLRVLVEEFSGGKGQERRNWTDETITEKLDIISGRFPSKSLVLMHAAFVSVYRHSSEVLHGTYFSALHFWGMTSPPWSGPKSKDELLKLLREHQLSVLTATMLSLLGLLECIAVYIERPEAMQHVSERIKHMKNLPLLKNGE